MSSVSLLEKSFFDKLKQYFSENPGRCCDVTFLVGSKKEIIKTSRIILEIVCPAFITLFDGKWGEAVARDSNEKNEIHLLHVDPQAFKLFLNLMITEDVSVEALEKLNLVASELLNVTELCLEYKMMTIYQNLQVLAQKVLINNNFSAYSATPGFLTLSQSNIKTLLCSDELVGNASEIVDAAIKWSEFQCSEKKIEKTRENMRQILADVLFQLPFSTMTLTDFSENTRITDVLTEKEQNQIFRYLCLSDDKKALYERSSFAFSTRNRCTNYLSTHWLLEDFSIKSSPPDVCAGQLTLESGCASVKGVTAGTFNDKNSRSSSEQQQNPKAPYIVLKERGNDLFRAQKYREALTLYTKAIEEETPESAEDLALLYQNRAAVFEKLGDYTASIKECWNALILNPKYVKALSRRSKAYVQTGFLNEALEDMTAVCILENFQHNSSTELAEEVLKRLGEKEVTRVLQARKLVAPSPHAVSAFLRSSYNNPITVLWNSTPKTGGNSGDTAGDSEQNLTAYKAAVQKLQEKDYESIIDLCTEEINNSNTEYLIESHHLRGTFRLLWGIDDGAFEDFTEVINAATSSDLVKASALLKLGSFLAFRDPFSDYMKCFDQAEALTPDNVDVFYGRGKVLVTLGVFDEAVRQLEKATKICPDFALAAASHLYMVYHQHVRTNNHKGRKNAFKTFPKLLRKYPTSPDVFRFYGQVLMENQQCLEAGQHFQKGLELDPGFAVVYVRKAMAQFKIIQDAHRMVDMMCNGLEMDDRNGFFYETLGTLELQFGNLEKAVEALGKALEYTTSFQEKMSLIYVKKAAEAQIKREEKFSL